MSPWLSMTGYMGAVEEMVSWATRTHGYQDNRSDGDMEGHATAAQAAFDAYVRRSPHEYAYIELGLPSGNQKILLELYGTQCPKTVQNFLALCTGEKGTRLEGVCVWACVCSYPFVYAQIRGLTHTISFYTRTRAHTHSARGTKLHYVGSPIHRIVKDGWLQGGDIVTGKGDASEAAFESGAFEDESFAVSHDRAGLLCMANKGPHTNGSQFYITMKVSCSSVLHTNSTFFFAHRLSSSHCLTITVPHSLPVSPPLSQGPSLLGQQECCVWPRAHRSRCPH